ncbi:HdeD family acid-resistance protein [Streptacidiphilus fuscans]|uniref:HdeD family acid-resistance protein n=1 Tax=Streptacidiphilus fuscans TaxID=2789292 RepID=A0A931FKR0_9ACTN|nr:HdeD family acid-resistance protein [Streptacidiphilus fuscans]MBF9073939.1 HdeD family acid-resistance protein [Streptacidiphilus fuscans]
MDQPSEPLSGDILPGPLQQLARSAWQIVMVLGVLTLALGVVVLVWPKESLRVVGVLFGLYLLIVGVFQLVAAFGTHVSTALRVMAFISGALSILLGLFCFRGALESILLLALWIGIGWLFRGITHTMAAVSDPSMPARGWQIFMGVLTALGGVVVLVAPFGSIAVLTAFAGAWLLVMGVLEIVTGFQVRSRAKAIPHGM